MAIKAEGYGTNYDAYVQHRMQLIQSMGHLATTTSRLECASEHSDMATRQMYISSGIVLQLAKTHEQQGLSSRQR